MRSLTALAFATTLAMLTGCAHLSTASSRQPIPEIPADLQTCFDGAVKVPGKRGTPLTQEQVTALITQLWASDGAKTRCGRRLLAFISNLRADK